jgi:hypothetical protein
MAEYLKTKTFKPEVEKKKHDHIVSHFHEKYLQVSNSLKEKELALLQA